MNGKLVISIGLPLLVMVIGIKISFYEFLIGSPATIKNFTVSVLYLVTWIICLVIAPKTANKMVINLYTLVWVFTLGIAGLTAYIQITDTTAYFGWAIPLATLFLTPWIGLNYLVDSYLFSSIIVIVFSVIMLLAIQSIRRKV